MTHTIKSTWTSPFAFTMIVAPECSPRPTAWSVSARRTWASTTTSTGCCPPRMDWASFRRSGMTCTSTKARRTTWTTRSADPTAPALSHLTGVWAATMHRPMARYIRGRPPSMRIVRAGFSSNISTRLTRVPLRRLASRARQTVQNNLSSIRSTRRSLPMGLAWCLTRGKATSARPSWSRMLDEGL